MNYRTFRILQGTIAFIIGAAVALTVVMGHFTKLF
jgi:hypothetical protein